MSQRDYDENGAIILLHETAHIIQRHWLDLLFINLVSATHWFNPIVWMLRRELILSHEYSADRETLKNGELVDPAVALPLSE